MTALKSILEIDPSIIRSNIQKLKNKTSNTSNFLAVIKSDAYGHMLNNIASDIDDLVDGYGVVRLDEAIDLRKISQKKSSSCRVYILRRIIFLLRSMI